MQAARILYTRVQFVHILHMCTLHVCCVERNICAAHILRLSIFVRVWCTYGLTTNTMPTHIVCAHLLLHRGNKITIETESEQDRDA